MKKTASKSVNNFSSYKRTYRHTYIHYCFIKVYRLATPKELTSFAIFFQISFFLACVTELMCALLRITTWKEICSSITDSSSSVKLGDAIFFFKLSLQLDSKYTVWLLVIAYICSSGGTRAHTLNKLTHVCHQLPNTCVEIWRRRSRLLNFTLCVSLIWVYPIINYSGVSCCY